MSGPVIAIDGPAGSGKSTVAAALAEQTGIPYLSTGLLYRAVAYAALQAGVQAEANKALQAFLAQLRVDVVPDGAGAFDVHIDGQPCAQEKLRSDAVSDAASRFAALAPVREKLLQLQRAAARPEGVVVEGRDTGSVVFPEADLKVFLHADPRERARRRALELGLDPQDETVLASLQARDRRDRDREVAPLTVAPGAVEIDATELSVADIVDRLIHLLG